jgi:hypothetical protein
VDTIVYMRPRERGEQSKDAEGTCFLAPRKRNPESRRASAMSSEQIATDHRPRTDGVRPPIHTPHLFLAPVPSCAAQTA